VLVDTVTPGYFATMGIPLLAGRDFGSGDTSGQERVAVINEALRRRLTTSRPLLGARLKFDDQQLTVIGIVASTPDTSLRESPDPAIYLPLAQTIGSAFGFGRLTVLARVQGADPAALVPAIKQVVWANGHDIVIDEVVPMNERLAASVRTERESALLFGLLAAIALVVAVTGVYGVVAYSVAQRTREIGLRIALGASRRQVIAEAVRACAGPVMAGVAIGLVAAALGTRTLTSLLFEVEPTDPVLFASTAIALVTTALIAAWIPAARAAAVDPVTALRAE
jgi:ABC-type lipoprotein release transport system permease subunit